MPDADYDALAVALCEHYARTRIISKGVVIDHLREGEATPCESCRAAARAVGPRVLSPAETTQAGESDAG